MPLGVPHLSLCIFIPIIKQLSQTVKLIKPAENFQALKAVDIENSRPICGISSITFNKRLGTHR